ncbi:DUF4433 domain-containing protein [Oceanobacillus sp. M65]|uniref:DUF4433 domain-containing protein n=1 Tax=Oceanobacillus sp. M65 TaxID=3457435 RepID=UPI003FCCC3E3
METVSSAKELLLCSHVTKYLPQNCKWWSNYIYHFSHITNIASILNDGILCSRNQVNKKKIENLNDNASSDVISGTVEEYKDYVRFYFRPLTPTQFHNEGIRAKVEITELGAHCPVPVFLLFDTEILDEPNVYFSYESLASHHYVPIHQGVEELAEAPFNYIYHNDSTFGLDGSQIRKHRQAEIVVKNHCNLDYLQRIVCRTKAEADTLKHLLDDFARLEYQDMICYIDDGTFDTKDSNTIFHGDFLKIFEVYQSKSHLIVDFNRKDSYSRNIDIRWFDRGGEICSFARENYIISANQLSINMNDFILKRDQVELAIKLDGNLIYCNSINL